MMVRGRRPCSAAGRAGTPILCHWPSRCQGSLTKVCAGCQKTPLTPQKIPPWLIPPPHELIRSYAVATKKHFGQHFLSDPALLGRIAQLVQLVPGDRVLEIGPGCGTLTGELLRQGARLTAVEIDRDAAAFLAQEAFPHDPQFTLLQGDALHLDFGEILASPGPPWKVVANLPYNVGTEILFRLAAHRDHLAQMALMFQLEVAQRLVATPAQRKAYGSLSLMTQTDFHTRLAMTLPPGAFFPPPKVKSAVVHFVPIPGSRLPQAQEREQFETVVRTAFNQRRKTLLNALSPLGLPRDHLRQALQDAGIAPKSRPEVVSFDQFHALTKALLALQA